MSKNITKYENLIAFHPGYYISDVIEELEMSQIEFAKRLDTNAKTISQLVNGQIPLSDDVAQKLSQMLGTSVGVWLNLQKAYDEKICEIKAQELLDEECKYLEVLDYNYFVKQNAVQPTRDKYEKVKRLRSCFKVADLRVLTKQDLLTACRTAVNVVSEKNIINANAWIQLGLNLAQNIDCSKYDEKLLKEAIPKIKALMHSDLKGVSDELRTILKNCGIAFVQLPYLKNSCVNGAVKWMNEDKALLLINDKSKKEDVFWFSLFHEIKHILQRRLKVIYVNSDDKNMSKYIGAGNEADELEADKFAQDTLIAPKRYEEFTERALVTSESIEEFAKSIDVPAGIVVGRLQKDEKIPWNRHNNLKRQCRY